jgi:hypothetical protein
VIENTSNGKCVILILENETVDDVKEVIRSMASTKVQQ